METAPIENQVQETPEAPIPEAKPGEAANRFSFLAKKEAGIVKQRQELKNQLAAMEAEKAEIARLKAEIEAARSKAGSYKSNPLALLEDHGMTYKELTDYILNNNTVSTESQIKALNEKLEQVERQREQDRIEAQKRAEEQAKAREAAVIQEFRSEIDQFIKTKSDTYELTALYDSADLVYDTVEAYFEKTQKVLSIPEACDLVEKYLESQVEKSLKTKKLSTKLSPAQSSTEKDVPPAPRRTLSNTEYTSSTPSLVSPKVESDRMARALAALDL